MGHAQRMHEIWAFCKGGMGQRDICASLKTWGIPAMLAVLGQTLDSECLECDSGRCDAGVGCHR